MKKFIHKTKIIILIALLLLIALIVGLIISKNHNQSKKQSYEKNDTNTSINIENEVNILKTSGDNITLDNDELEVKNIVNISAKNAFEDLNKIYKVDNNANLYSVSKIGNDLSIGSIVKKAEENESTSDQILLVLRRSYPIVTLEEMGLETEEEAYQATQLALWEVFSRTGESKEKDLITRIQLIKEELENNNININEKVFTKAEELVEYVEKYSDDEQKDKIDLVPTLLVDNSLVELVEQPEKEEDKYLVGPYSFVIKSGYFIKSNITVKDENGNLVHAKFVDKDGNELKEIGENTEFYLSFKELPKNTKYTLGITADLKRIVVEFYENNGKEYVANTYTNVSVPIELTINFESRATIGEINLITYDEDGNIEGGKTVILYDSEEEIGRAASGRDGKINYYNVPEGEYKLVKIDDNGNEIKSEVIQVAGGEITSVNL